MPTSSTRTSTSRAKTPPKGRATAKRPAPARKPAIPAGAKNFGFDTKPATGGAVKGEEFPDIVFYLGNGDPTPYYVRGDADADGLGIISAQVTHAERVQDYAVIGESLIEIMENLFTPETGAALLAKIKAKELRIQQHLTPIIEWAIEQVSERPTTP